MNSMGGGDSGTNRAMGSYHGDFNSEERSKLGTDISSMVARKKSGVRGAKKSKSKSTILSGGTSAYSSRALRAGGLKSGNQLTNQTSAQSSPTRDDALYKKLKDGSYSYEQTRQMLMARQQAFQNRKSNRTGKYSPTKVSQRDLQQLSRMIHSNSRYLTVPHGMPEHLKKYQVQSQTDRNRVFA